MLTVLYINELIIFSFLTICQMAHFFLLNKRAERMQNRYELGLI